MKNNKLLLKQIVKHYTFENEDIRLNQIEHKIDILSKQKDSIDIQIDNLKNSMEHLKDKKQKLSDLISKLRFEKQKVKLTDKGII